MSHSWCGVPDCPCGGKPRKLREGEHTPGPWSVDYSGPARLTINDKDGRTIAFGNLQTEDGDEDEANARLIAAAPTMLETLQDAPAPSGPDWQETYIKWFHKRCAALKAAQEG